MQKKYHFLRKTTTIGRSRGKAKEEEKVLLTHRKVTRHLVSVDFELKRGERSVIHQQEHQPTSLERNF